MPDFRGRQALDAWLTGHDLGLLLQGTDPDGHPLINGVVVAQSPPPGTGVDQWATVTVWVADDGEPAGVREPRRPLPNRLTESEAADEPS